MSLPDPDEGRLSRIVEEAIREDVGMGDVTTSSIVGDNVGGRGELLVKAPGVLAGLHAAALVFRFVDEEIAFAASAADGDAVAAGQVVANVEGSFGALLIAERTALNMMQRMSGIATLTAAYVEAVRGTRARITDTRKTAPGLRLLDKLAVKAGGGVNHRFGLDDMALIKDNHIAVAGGVKQAIERCVAGLRKEGRDLPIEVETRTLDDVRTAMTFPAVTRIMFDHFEIPAMKAAVDIVEGRKETEASGNVTLGSVGEIARTGVGFISIGALTHSAPALDISMKIRPLA